MKFFIVIAILFSTQAFSQPDNRLVEFTVPNLIPSEKTIFYKLSDRNIPVKILQYGDEKGIVYINVHDSEPTSVEAAKKILERNGGTLIKIENNHQRNIRFRLKNLTYTFDPNRIFSREGINQTLRNYGRINKQATDEIEKFAQRLLQLIPDSTSCIIALHNNANQAFSIESYLAGHEKQFDARAVYADSLQDIDDIALTTDSLLYQKMADNRYNTIWQDNKNAKKDGSLSIYCGERNRRYINIETEHGKLNQHIEMLEKLWIILTIQNKKSPGTPEDFQ